MKKERTIKLADESKITLTSHGQKVAEIEFSIPEQSISVSFYGRNGSILNPVMISVDTQMLGHSEDEE